MAADGPPYYSMFTQGMLMKSKACEPEVAFKSAHRPGFFRYAAQGKKKGFASRKPGGKASLFLEAWGTSLQSPIFPGF